MPLDDPYDTTTPEGARATFERSRARQDALALAQREDAQREQDRQSQANLLAQQQQFSGQRDAFDAQQANQRHGMSLSAAYQQHLDTVNAQERERQQHLSPYDMKDPKTGQVVGKLPWSVLEAYGHSAQQEQELGERARQFDTSEERRGHEFDTEQQRRAYEFDAAHGEQQRQFELNRQPSERDQFQADEQSQHIAEHAQAQAWANSQELSHKEMIEYQRLQNARATVQQQLDAGEISPEEFRNVMTQIQTRVDPMRQRLERQQMATQQAAEQQHMATAAKQAAMAEQEMRFHAQSFGEHVGQYTDENGKTWHGFQVKPGHWDVKDPYERERLDREHALKAQQQMDTKNETLKARHEGRLDSAVKQTTSQWQSDYTHTSRLVDKDIQDAQQKADKVKDYEDPEKKAAEQRWVAKLKDNRDSMIHDRMKQMKRWKDVGADKDALDAALEADKQSKLESWQPPLHSQGPQQPQRQPTEAERIQQQHERDRIPGGMTINPPQWANPGAPAPAPQAPPQAAPQQAVAGGAMQQLDQMIGEARGGSQSVYAAATRIKAALSKYRTIDQMPPAEREQYLRDKRIAGLGQ